MIVNFPEVKTQPTERMMNNLARLVHEANVKRVVREAKGA